MCEQGLVQAEDNRATQLALANHPCWGSPRQKDRLALQACCNPRHKPRIAAQGKDWHICQVQGLPKYFVSPKASPCATRYSCASVLWELGTSARNLHCKPLVYLIAIPHVDYTFMYTHISWLCQYIHVWNPQWQATSIPCFIGACAIEFGECLHSFDKILLSTGASFTLSIRTTSSRNFL